MKKQRDPLDRSDVIAIISLGVALLGAVLSGFVSWQAYLAADEANRIASEANALTVKASNPQVKIDLIGGDISSDRNGRTHIEWVPCHDFEPESKYRPWGDQYFITALAETYDVVISNLGGRSITLMNLRLASPDWAGTNVYENGQFTNLPVEVPPGGSRMLRFRARWSVTFTTPGDAADAKRVQELYETTLKDPGDRTQLTWLLQFNDGTENPLSTTSYSLEGPYVASFDKSLPDCHELWSQWTEGLIQLGDR